MNDIDRETWVHIHQINAERRREEDRELPTLKKEKTCPKCGQDGVFDVYEMTGGCEDGEVTKIHCSDCSHIFDPRIHWREEK